MMPPTSIDGTDITGATIDGTDVQEITVDGQTVFTAGPNVPDADDLLARYDFTQENGTVPVTDTTGNGFDLTNGSYSGVGKTIGGLQAGDFDGVDDVVEETSASESPPIHVFASFQYESLSGGTKFLFGQEDDTSSFGFGVRQISSDYRLNQGGSDIDGGSTDTNAHIGSALFASTDVLRIDGSQVASGNAGSGSLNGIALGSRTSGPAFSDVLIGEVLIYDTDKTSKQSTIESYLSNRWSISI